MNASPDSPANARQALAAACKRIAPNWPLDQLIAVNPWWHWRDQPFSDASARLSALGHVQCLMPADYYRALWQKSIKAAHLEQAIDELDAPLSSAALLSADDKTPPRHWYNISDLVDAHRSAASMSWHEEIIHQLSQFSGDLLQQGHTDELDANRFYQAWLDVTRADRGLAILMAEPRLTELLADLPNDVDELIEAALADLAVDNAQITDYGLALLLDINGWAANLAWLDWQAKLQQQENTTLLGLLAARLAWDWLLWQLHPQADWHSQWQQQWHSLPALLSSHTTHQHKLMVWQRAAELAEQSELIKRLRAPWVPSTRERPQLQAAFCIDVRSERMRRALEAQHPSIETLGFAGFFGLPVAYRPGGNNYLRPQLPGLLAPALEVSDNNQDGSRNQSARKRRIWQDFAGAAPTTFTAVESGGLFYLFKLLRQSLFPGKVQHPVNRLAADARFDISRDGATLSASEKAELAAGILRAMGLTQNLAPRVLLVGHGSSSCNNPHAAGLDCGACGGQTGEINVRVLAQLLNDPAVRQSLEALGIRIPDDVRFIAALHDTTTDDIHCFQQSSADLDITLYNYLQRASEQVRKERAPALGLAHSHDIAADTRQRSRDWSQVRPEWGLANNHSFIVAPRERTRHLDLGGRSFLHNYRWQHDDGFALLELIMTAPMVVTHWINMQYNASVTDPQKFGSGNKVLHNVVGGNLGVFEGNGGDLRIGLPIQSVHDGKRWMHAPLRLSVFIAAPEAAISTIYWKHEVVRQLVDNEWLYLFSLGDAPGECSQLVRGEWFAEPNAHKRRDEGAAA